MTATFPVRSTAFEAYGRAVDRLPPAERVVLAYDAAIRFVREARAAIGRGDIEGRFRAGEKARSVIRILDGALDHERGDRIAADLTRLYTYLERRLTELNIKNDPEIADEITSLLRTLREGWARLAPLPGAGGAAAAPPARAGSDSIALTT